MQLKRGFSRIVVKVGSSLMSAKDARLSIEYINGIVRQVNALLEAHKEVVLVSSGAIACGMSLLKLKKRPSDISSLQAAAAIGQSELMAIYRRLLKRHNRLCAQLLVTWEDFEDRRRYLNIRKTLQNLLKGRILAVINENDTVSTEEIRFGDNDRLSSLVANLIGADLLLILSDVEGLYRLPAREVIGVVEKITPEINELCCNTDKQTCVGGMSSKIEAVKIAANSGIPAIIASGKAPDTILKAASGQPVGTLFMPKGQNLEARKRWIAYGARPKGALVIDEGAKNALVKSGKSLLSVGIVAIKGTFANNETVSILDRCMQEIARGKVNYCAKELEERKGARLKKEVIHRDNLVLL